MKKIASFIVRYVEIVEKMAAALPQHALSKMVVNTK
jgi:hypothetical protein